ncbi:MAG: hypothetical protein ABIP35_09770 [Ginsengibacter sp.]
MKKYLLFFLMIVGSTSCLTAQNGNGQRGERIQALKIAFLTQKLKLTSAEAEKFWPVYNEYEEEVKGIRAGKNDDDVLENEQKLLDIKKKYKSKFEKILGSEKVITLYNAEKEFRNVLIKRLKNQRQKGLQ